MHTLIIQTPKTTCKVNSNKLNAAISQILWT